MLAAGVERPRQLRPISPPTALDLDELGDNGQSNLAVFYKSGIGGLSKDDERAARLFKLAADQGDGAAQTNLGDLYATGRGLGKNEVARIYKLAPTNAGPRHSTT